MGDAAMLAILELLFLAVPMVTGLAALDLWERYRARRASGTRQAD